MTADEIRKQSTIMEAACKTPEMAALSSEQQGKAMVILAGSFAFAMMAEIAAQLADMNTNLAKLNAKLDEVSSGGQIDVKVWER